MTAYVIAYLSDAVVLMHRRMMSFMTESMTFSKASGRMPCIKGFK